MTGRRAGALCLALILSLPATAAAAPQRVMSLNLCTDQLLMALLPPERIASITSLSRTEGDPVLQPLAWRLAANRGSAEEVLHTAPDLVLAGRHTTAATRALLHRVGVPVMEVDAANDWESIRRVTRAVAHAVGAVEQGEALIAAMNTELAALAARPARTPLRVVGWDGSADSVPGAGTLFDTIVSTAGGVNLAATEGAATFDLEQVLRARPDALLRSAAYGHTPAQRNSVAVHRVLRERYAGRMLTYPEAVYGCGVPRAAQLAVELASEFDRIRALASP